MQLWQPMHNMNRLRMWMWPNSWRPRKQNKKIEKIFKRQRKVYCWQQGQLFLSPVQPKHQSDAASNPLHHALLPGRLVAESCPRLCSQLDWGHGWLTATYLARWMCGRWLPSALAHGGSSDTSGEDYGVRHALQRTGRDPTLSTPDVLKGE